MISFTIDGISKLGDSDETYGQRYWATTSEGDLPLMFNSMRQDLDKLVEDGPFQIVAEEKTEKESSKGNPYLLLKKVKLVEPTQSKITKEKVAEVFGSEKPSEGSKNAQLDRIEAAIQELQSSVDRLLG